MAEGEEPTWNSSAPWRQGHVLTPEAVAHLGLVDEGLEDEGLEDEGAVEEQDASQAPGSVRVIVVSHDCDLATTRLDVEPDVEVLVGRVAASLNGNFAWGKSPRTLHLPVSGPKGPEVLELVQTAKRRVPKTELVRFAPATGYSVDAKGLTTLRRWLATRYDRAAFADAFVQRLSDAKVDQRLAKVLEPSQDLISFIYFDVEDGHTVERAIGNPYRFSVVLVFAAGEDAEVSADQADEIAEQVEKEIQKRLKDPLSLVLMSCFAISEDDLSVGRAKLLTQWRLEHMTLRANEPQSGPPDL